MRNNKAMTINSNICCLPFRHHGVLNAVDVTPFDKEEHFFVPEIDFYDSTLHVSSF